MSPMTEEEPTRTATTGACPVCRERRYLTQRGPVAIHPHSRFSRAGGRTVATRCAGSGQPPVGSAPGLSAAGEGR